MFRGLTEGAPSDVGRIGVILIPVLKPPPKRDEKARLSFPHWLHIRQGRGDRRTRLTQHTRNLMLAKQQLVC